MTPLRGVLFDVGGVFHRYVGGPVAQDIGEYLGISHEDLARAWDDLIPLLGTGRIEEAEFWRRFQASVGTDKVLPVPSLLVRRFGDRFLVYPEVLEWARGLRERGLRVGILSDTVEVQADWVRARGLYDGFDAVVLSHEIGWRKPSPEAYAVALARLGTSAEQTAFIDDTPANVAGARAVGMQAVLFVSFAPVRDELERRLRPDRVPPDSSPDHHHRGTPGG